MSNLPFSPTRFTSASEPLDEPPHSPSPRTIILCFDGTGNKFGENSNVVRFFRALRKDEPEKQLVYYQPGIGTYNKRQFFTRTFSSIASTLDQAIALHLNDHVKDGYRFVMEHYRQGDKICLFGFSRGAHTARVVAGMLYKIGLLPRGNEEQLDFAFSVYQTTGDQGYVLSKEFRQTFAMPVRVEFVGVWDTVSSVGIIPRYHPYTSVNYAVKTFRHALALDERRARFRPSTWNEPTLSREQELDVEEPKLDRGNASRDDWVYEPPERDYADVQEVWFAGCHADVGGGSHKNEIQDSLSYIPLRWMIKECFVSRTGILFDHDYLVKLGFNLGELAQQITTELKIHGLEVDLSAFGFDTQVLKTLATPGRNTAKMDNAVRQPAQSLRSLNGISRHSPVTPPTFFHHQFPILTSRIAHDFPKLSVALQHARDHHDALAKLWDQLVDVPAWWALEVLPLLTTYQDEDGNWTRKRMRNFGQGRYIPYDGDEIRVHDSVRKRIATEGTNYKPSAYNWDAVVASGMLRYVH